MQEHTIVRETRQAVVDNEAKPYLLAHRIMDFFLFLIEGFLLLSFIFQATAANQTAGFVRFVDDAAEILMLPFRFIFPSASAGNVVIDWSILVAMLIYALIFYAVRKAIGVVYTADQV